MMRSDDDGDGDEMGFLDQKMRNPKNGYLAGYLIIYLAGQLNK